MKKWILAAVLLLFASPAHAQFSRIITITGQTSAGAQSWIAASPFIIKAGPNCTWTPSGTTYTFNCAGGGGIAGTIANTQVAFGTAANTIGGSNNFTWDGNTVNVIAGAANIAISTTTTDEDSLAFVTTNTGGAAGNAFALQTVAGGGGNAFLTYYNGTNTAFFTFTGTNITASPRFTSPIVQYPQGAVAACATATTICEQAPASVTTYSVVKPPVAAQGTLIGRNTAAVITQGFSGDAGHSAVVIIGSGSSIGSTSLCSTANCTVGTYRVNAYLDITTACTISGTYLVSLIYTDDVGSKTVPINLSGTGAVPATGIVTTTSTANFGQAAQILRSTGAASINYSTTALACGGGGPMVGNVYLSVEPVQ